MSQTHSRSNGKIRPPLFETLELRRLLSAAPQVMGYMPDYQIGNPNPVFYEDGTGAVSDHVDWKDLKQVNYFAVLPNSDGTLLDASSSGYKLSEQLPLLVQHANVHGVKVVVTVGGGDTGKSIPAMNALIGAGQNAWNTFASRIKTFCNTYGLAGVDLDWEPVSTTTAMIQNFGKLVKTIKQADPSLSLSADVLGDPTGVTDAGSGQGYTLDTTAVQYVNAVNVMAYYETAGAAATSVHNWATYVTAGTDVNGGAVRGQVGQVQYGMEVDNTTSPANVVEAKVDDAINRHYGGVFVWTLTEDTASSSLISRIGAEVAKDTAPKTGSVSGTVTAGGKGLANVTVYLDGNSNGKLDSNELHTTTGSTGAYSLGNVPAASYTVRQNLPSGDTQTSPTNNAGHAITVTGGSIFTGENFVDTVPAAVGKVSGSVLTTSGAGVMGVTVYLDANNNGKLNTGELHTTTGSTGAYAFSNVPAKAYVVRQVVPTGDSQSSPTSNGGHSVTVIANSDFTHENFVDVVPTGSVSGRVRTPSAAGLSGITVYLDANNNGKLDTGELHTTTTSSGSFTFSAVPIGAYVVRQVVAAGKKQTSPTGNTGHSITVTKGAKLTDENFTDAPSAAKLSGTIISSSVSNNSTRARAFDGNLSTTFHGSAANGNWLGLDLGTARTLTQIKFAAASADPYNMEGGVFRGSNTANFSTAVNLYTVPNTTAPSATSLTTINVSGKYRYVRYLAPGGSYGDVAEIQFYGY